MLSIVVVAALAVLAALTQAGVLALQRAHPAQGRMIEVEGARLHVVDIGPRDAAGPPIVMLHGASSNLEAMRRPLGERHQVGAQQRRVLRFARRKVALPLRAQSGHGAGRVLLPL